MKKLSTILVLLLCLIDIGFVPNVYGQAVALPYSQDFSTANDFTFVNGSQTNIWNYGTAVGNPGGSIYISNNSGTANAYTTGSPSISHAYKDFIIPAGSTLATFSFDWRAYGESTYDYLRVWLVPATYTPTAGTAITAAGGRIQVGAYFNQISAWQTYTNYSLNVGSFAGNTMRLVYEWTNDDSFGTQPPAAVDNISLLIPTCVQPSAPVTSAIGANTATIAWTAPTVAPGNGYEYYLSTTNTAPTAATTGTAAAGTSVILPSLTTSTTYYWWVRSVCSATDKSVWLPGGNFTTTQIPATLPYSQDFTTNNDFGFTNGTYTNKWAYGNAAGNPAGAIYISNDNGTTNAYTLSSSESTVHAYRDITIPAGTTTATFSFDWKGVGESTYDYLKVWLVPVSYTPTAGTLITAGSGRIQVGPDYINLQSAWQNYMNPSLNISSFAGTTMRLVFQWRNDGSGGSQPPIAVDNVNLFVPSCNVPTALTVSAQTSNGASLAWTAAAPAPGNGYEYYLSTTNTAPTAATVGTAVTGTTATPGGLASYTTYYWWVRSICSSTNKSIWIPGPAFTTGQIGTGTGTSGYLPIYSYYGYNYSQQIYTKAELVAAVGANNYITAVRFYVATPQTPQANYNQWVVYLGNTTQTTFASNTNWIPLANLTQVYSGTLPNMTAGTWVEIPLSTPFIWDGDSNIVVAVDENSPGYSSSGATWGSYTAGSNRGILYYADGTNPNPASPPSASNRYADIPRIQFKGEPLLPCSTNPPANIAMGVVTASTATVTWTPAIGATYTIRYRVQGTGAWTTAGTVVSPGNSITIPGLTEQTTYEVQIATTCSGTQGSYSPSTVFTTPPLSYCNMTGNGADYIANVTVTSANVGFLPMSNTTLQTNYTSYNTPATLINLDIGSTGNQISVAKGWTGSTYSDAVTAWIDFNRNGTFEDSERILISAASTTTPVAAYFDVPATAYNGPLTTTMRVISRRTSAPVMCQTPVDNGEVEDYAVRLRPCSTVVPNTPTFTLTTHNSTTINWTAVANVTYQVRYRKQGPPAGPWEVKYASTQLANIPLLIDGLDPATIYDVQIATVCGSNVGTYSPITSFTTRCDPTPPSITISNITTNSASVTWAPLVPNSTYIMRYRIVGTTTWTTVNLPNPPANTYPLSGLDPYTSYEVQIANQCVGETTPNPWSNPKVFTTERTCELPPPGLTITNLTPTTAVVVWD
ncbi:fibronectin type III domain-containing protein, partial [Chryseobacterium sp. FH2]|uniref:fibronectin type III domain-containing protein n=1 Tax=Chryseobacterium sp. FH2 TaxID=1674291 RepID=UPI00065AF0BB